MVMQILQGTDHLHRVALNFKFVQSLTSLNQIVERLVGTDLQQNVDVFVVLEKVLKLAYKGVFDTFVDPDLRHELLLGARFGERSLLDKFASKDRLGLLTYEFIALCEPALSQEFSLVVVAGADAPIFEFKFLLN